MNMETETMVELFWIFFLSGGSFALGAMLVVAGLRWASEVLWNK
jgi:hypothetical protein